jgi:MoaA/NifB/PqqE/SkfB family radical SAM enzyme
MKPFSIVFQILQDCIFRCPICNRRYVKNEKRLNKSEREHMVENLLKKGLKRLTITGGEPMLIKDELIEFIEYIHSKSIHSCLSTSGYNITEELLIRLDKSLDQLLLSIPTYNRNEWQFFYGNKKHSINLYNTAFNILELVKNTDIILEVSTVLFRNNIPNILNLGYELAKINPNIIWRIEYYYPMGIYSSLKDFYAIKNNELFKVHDRIKTEFKDTFKFIYYSQPSRITSPDFFITPNGNLVTTNGEKYGEPITNVLDTNLLIEFNMRRKWKDYQIYCRNWDN